MKNWFKIARKSPSPEPTLPIASSTSLAESEASELPVDLMSSRKIIFAGGINLIFNIATVIISATTHRGTGSVFPPSVLGSAASIISIGAAIVEISRRKKYVRNGARRRPKKRVAAIHIAVFLAISSIISSLVIITLDSIGKHKIYFGLPGPQKVGLITIASLSIVTNVFLATTATKLTWRPDHQAARSVMMAASTLQFVVGTLLVAGNWNPWVGGVQHENKRSATAFAVHQHVGSLETAVSVLGFALGCVIQESKRTDRHFTGLIHFYAMFSSFVALLLLVLLIISIKNLVDGSIGATYQGVTLASNPILDGTALLLIVVNFICTKYLQQPPASHLKVEILDIAALTDRQREAYARLIDKHGRQIPGAPSGEAAMSLMQAYVGTAIPNMSCTVLRVYKPAPPKNRQIAIGLRPTSATLWGDEAWLHLDEEKMILRQATVDADTDPITPPVQPAVLSKTQLKRLARKQATAVARGETVVIPELQDPGTTTHLIPFEDDFKTQLETTEALVLLTTITDFDLTSSVKGWPGKLLNQTLGSKSYFKPLCIRLGLLATHFPFRESTFYCSPTRRPVARSAAVLRTIDQWNRSQKSATRCSVLLNPTYQHEAIQRAIIPSGWQPSPLAPSHIVDLTPYKYMTTAEYLKGIKYRDQESAFKKAGGQVVESTSFTAEECAEVMRLWRQIAAKRASKGGTPVLAVPDESFVKQMGSGGTGDRSLMFLKVDGHTVASCVLFRLGDTITSDLQGLDYELARPLKAYFVMMQHVIGVALREGRSFVDFGPTTAKPKVDIGCKSVPLIGAMCAVSPVISFAIGLAAKATSDEISGE